jgi:hypothetical protein
VSAAIFNHFWLLVGYIHAFSLVLCDGKSLVKVGLCGVIFSIQVHFPGVGVGIKFLPSPIQARNTQTQTSKSRQLFFEHLQDFAHRFYNLSTQESLSVQMAQESARDL